MENLELQNEIINLGKLLIKELNLDPSVDTFSKWMAHYIAEKMTIAENSTGIEKQDAEKECFDIILKLWEHRWNFPSDKRPLKDFESILKLLEKINPDNDNDYYPSVICSKLYPDAKTEQNIPLDSSWENIANEIDRVARIWIEHCLTKAVENIDKEKTKEWISNSVKLPNNDDIIIINFLIDDKLKETSSVDDTLKAYKISRLESRISELEKFKKLNDIILNSYKDELNKL